MRGHIRVRDGKRGTTYQVVVFLGVDGAGKRRYVRETVQGSRRDAEARLAELIVAVNTGARGAPARYRFCDLVDAWWETSTAHLSPWTRIGYKGMLDRYLLPKFGTRRIDKIAPLEVERWYRELLTGPPPLAPLTVRKVHTLASTMLATAVRWGWLTENPLRRVRAPRGRAKAMRAPEPEEVATALAAAAEFGEELHVFLRLSAALGTRRGETAALRWCDVDLDAGDVHVHRALAPLERDQKQVLEKGTKTHASARLAIDTETVEILRRFRAGALRAALACGIALAADAYVFSQDVAGAVPWHPDHFGHQWARLRKKIGLEHVRLHDFRHFHGTELAAAGVPMTVVRDRLRHSDIRTTSIYAHGRRALDRAAADAIGAALAVGDTTNPKR